MFWLSFITLANIVMFLVVFTLLVFPRAAVNELITYYIMHGIVQCLFNCLEKCYRTKDVPVYHFKSNFSKCFSPKRFNKKGFAKKTVYSLPVSRVTAVEETFLSFIIYVPSCHSYFCRDVLGGCLVCFMSRILCKYE